MTTAPSPAWGSLNINDEGEPTRRIKLLDKGINTSYMIDKLGSRRINMPSTGSGRRESYRFAPTSRMTNTFIAPGQDENSDIIASVENGLYAAKMGGGSVNPVTCEFNFAVAGATLSKTAVSPPRARCHPYRPGRRNTLQHRYGGQGYDHGSGHVRLRKRQHPRKCRSGP